MCNTWPVCLQDLDPEVCIHLHRLGIPLAALAMPWICRAFVGYLPVSSTNRQSCRRPELSGQPLYLCAAPNQAWLTRWCAGWQQLNPFLNPTGQCPVSQPCVQPLMPWHVACSHPCHDLTSPALTG
jgi:hypothetical protein